MKWISADGNDKEGPRWIPDYIAKHYEEDFGSVAKERGFVRYEDQRMEARFTAAMWESAGVNTRAQ